MTDSAREWLEAIYRKCGNTPGADWGKAILERLDVADALEAEAAAELKRTEDDYEGQLGSKEERIAELEQEIETVDRETSEAWKAAGVDSHAGLMEFLNARNP
jgi:hypothetical protein